MTSRKTRTRASERDMSLNQLKPGVRRGLLAAAAVVVGGLSLGVGSAPVQAQYYPYYPYAYPYAYYPYYAPYYYGYPYGYGYPYFGPSVSLGFSFGGHHRR